MVGASKILTVSYGTFSCTLEGFEEPFSTMKAIAEYFRDLAADDRYFGAEPPTPDAEMLHRIAEREIQRRVEAKISEHGIVLRAETEAAAEPLAPKAPSSTSVAALMAAAAAAPKAATVAAPKAPVAETPEPAVVEPVAEEWAEETAEDMTEEIAAEGVFGEDMLIDDLPEDEAALAPLAAAPVIDEEEIDSDSESVAAKLMRIRAVVAAAQAAPVAGFDATSAEAESDEETAFDASGFEEPAFEEEEAAADFAPSSTVPAGDFGFELDFDDFPATRPAAKAEDEDAHVETAEFEAVEEAGELVADEIEQIEAEDIDTAETETAAEEDIAAAAIEAEAETEVEVEDHAARSMIEAPVDDADDEEALEEETAEEEAAEAAILEEDTDVADEDEDRHIVAAMAEEIAGEVEAAEVEVAEVEAAEVESVEVEAVEEIDEFDEFEDDALEDEAEMAVIEAEASEAEHTEVEEAPEGALDLGAWRMDAEAADLDEAEDVAEEAADTAAEGVAEEAADTAAEIEAEDETIEAEAEIDIDMEMEAADEAEAEEDETETLEESKRGFFERARARVIKIGRAPAAPEAIADTAEEAMPAPETEEPLADDMSDEWAEDLADADDIDADDMEAEEGEEHRAAIFAALSEDTEAEYDDLEDTELEAEDDDAALLAGIGAAIGGTGLDPEAEDDLLRELADVARDARRDSHDGRAILEGNASDGEASVERLMEEAKSKLEGDESRRRFSAISHLKAAVAATVADRKLKSRDAPVAGAGEEAEEIERYRDDLSKAVRPRRPASETASTTRRPTIETRPAPLVLVSEQRIDETDGSRPEAAVVRPRRISADNLAVSDDSDQDTDTTVSLSPDEAKNFAEFAERLGAVDLSDMLEAAAAYTATVEGLPHFSRPQILSKIANVADDEEYSREDGLRSFGMLLRQGKIQKISRGQFTITESSRFMSEAHRAAR